MDTYDSLFSAGGVLSEQVVRQLFDMMPEEGPIMIIMDKEKNYWPSDTEKFSKLNINESFLREICAQIDDGVEPIVTSAKDCSIIAAQLATERTNCGYVIIILPQCNPESASLNIDLIEMLLNQICLIAKLIEKNNLLYELQMKHFNMYGQSVPPLN